MNESNEQEQAVLQTTPATEPKPETAKITTIVKAIQIKKPAKKAATVKGKGKKAVKQSTKAAKKTAKKNGKAAKTTTKTVKAIKHGKYPRNKANPFREGSSYGAIFDAFATKRGGIRRAELLKLAMNATGKDAKHAAYDLAVILSAKDSNNGPRHPSCRESFWIRRENDHLTLMID